MESLCDLAEINAVKNEIIVSNSFKKVYLTIDFLDLRLRTMIQIEMKHCVGRLIKTMSKAMPKRVLTCTMKTFKTDFKAVSVHNRLFSKQTSL